MKNIYSYYKTHEGTILVILAIVFSVFISLSVLMGKSIRLDEAQSMWQTNHTFLGTLRVVAADVHLPLYFVILRGWMYLFGTTAEILRSLSLLFLLISFPLLYIMAKDTYSKKVARYTVLISMVSPFLVWYGSEIRMYTLLFLVTAANHLFFLSFFRKQKSDSFLSWIGYGITMVLGVYTHYFFSLILLVQAIFYFTHRKLFSKNSFKYFSIIATIAIIQLTTWFTFRFIVGSAKSAPFLHTPTTTDLFNLFSNVYIGLQSNFFNSIFLSLWPIVLAIVFTLLARRKSLSPETLYLIQSVFIPIVITFIISIFVRPLFVARYLIVIVPALYVLTAYWIDLYSQKTSRILFGIVFFVMLFSTFHEVTSKEIPVNENYREAAMFVEQYARGNDIFVVSAPFTTYPIEYYYKGVAPLTTFPEWNRFESDNTIPKYTFDLLVKESTAWSKNYEYLYFLQSYDQGYEEEARLYLDNNFEKVKQVQFSPGLNLYVYKLLYL